MKNLVSLLVFCWISLISIPCLCQSDDIIWKSLPKNLNKQLATKKHHYILHCNYLIAIENQKIIKNQGVCNLVFEIYPSDYFIMTNCNSREPFNDNDFSGKVLGKYLFTEYGVEKQNNRNFCGGLYENYDNSSCLMAFDIENKIVLMKIGDFQDITFQIKEWGVSFDE